MSSECTKPYDHGHWTSVSHQHGVKSNQGWACGDCPHWCGVVPQPMANPIVGCLGTFSLGTQARLGVTLTCIPSILKTKASEAFFLMHLLLSLAQSLAPQFFMASIISQDFSPPSSSPGQPHFFPVEHPLIYGQMVRLEAYISRLVPRGWAGQGGELNSLLGTRSISGSLPGPGTS